MRFLRHRTQSGPRRHASAQRALPAAWARHLGLVVLCGIMALTTATVLPAPSIHAATSWQSAPALPTALVALAAVTGADGTLYAIGGQDNTGSIQSAVYSYNPATDTAWQSAPPLPQPLTELAAATGADGTLYAIGGDDDTGPVSTVYSYKPGTDTAWQSAPALPTALYNLAATTAKDGTLYVIGGVNSTGLQSAVYSYKPSTDTAWQSAPALPVALGSLAAVTGADGTIYAIGGQGAPGPQGSGRQSAVYSYKPGTDTAWHSAPALPVALVDLAATAGADGTLYAIGGSSDGSHARNTVYRFKPGADTAWQAEAALPAVRVNLAAATGADGTLYAIGGANAPSGVVGVKAQSTVYSFQPGTAATTTVGSSVNPVPVGQPVTYTATIAPAPDGGTVTFQDGGATIAGCAAQAVDPGSGTATCQVTYSTIGGHSITAFYSGDSAFDPSDSTATPYTQQIVPAPLTITAGSQSMTYGGTVPPITPTYSGLVNGDTAPATPPTCSTTASSSSPAGTYPTNCSGAADPNYSISYVTGTLTINPAAQAITFGMLPNHLLGDAPFTVTATGGASGNPVTFTAGPSSVCAAGGSNGATITLTGVGTCTVTASQSGNGNYQAATPVSQSFTVSYPPLYLAPTLTSSPAGPVTIGSVVTLALTLGNHTATAQTIHVKATLTYTGNDGTLSFTAPLKLTLAAGQTLSKSVSFTIQPWFPRGTYMLNTTATDGSGDTASTSAALTVS